MKKLVPILVIVILLWFSTMKAHCDWALSRSVSINSCPVNKDVVVDLKYKDNYDRTGTMIVATNRQVVSIPTAYHSDWSFFRIKAKSNESGVVKITYVGDTEPDIDITTGLLCVEDVPKTENILLYFLGFAIGVLLFLGVAKAVT